ncbi:hypothetical protein GCM10007276_19290 [Agaricicola taiwanensis]|uniref:DUF992 domain-containing protein n=1 Tax=Agaricicola taiwanensis TaxID=591372 RepID=A0A8J2VX73_9RHOB|nr:DUF992 domain-containing protein [Agaricicola taiwanensis]GGE42128.1 hypothetical protein GCM10007276_19290 [Agaricicola taiwanensis]
MKTTAITAATMTGLAFIATPAAAQETRVEVGVLNCSVEGGIGLILGSQKSTECRFQTADGKVTEIYTGKVTKVGIDIGVTGESQIVWAVFAPSNALQPGSLEGNYVGASVQATAGVGVGANALVGGSGNTIALQPISTQTQTGLNVAAGIGGISLNSPVTP